MTLEEFDNLKIGDEVVITGISNGKPAHEVWQRWVGQTVKISGDYTPGHPGVQVYRPSRPLSKPTITLLLSWPDEVEFPSPKLIKCECGASALGIELHAPGHSFWCPGV